MPQAQCNSLGKEMYRELTAAAYPSSRHRMNVVRNRAMSVNRTVQNKKVPGAADTESVDSGQSKPARRWGDLRANT